MFVKNLKNFLVVASLILGLFLSNVFLIIGVLCLWFLTTWKKGVKITLTVLAIYLMFAKFMYSAYIPGVLLARRIPANNAAMTPTYKGGEFLIVQGNYVTKIFNRGDVIVFQSPNAQVGQHTEFIKRIIGLPGEKVEIKNQVVYVNGKELSEPYLQKGTLTDFIPGGFIQEGVAVIVPQDHYFVLGDNRPKSSDSRDYGFVLKSKIQGVVLTCYWGCK